MKKYLFGLFVVTTLSLASDVDSINLHYMYEGAKEIEMLNRSMEAGIRQHNQAIQPLLTESSEVTIDNTPALSFQDMGDKFTLEKIVDNPKSTKINVSISGNMLKIETTTTQNKHIVTAEGMGETTLKSSTIEEITIPLNADSSKMHKEYQNGVLRVSFPKKS